MVFDTFSCFGKIEMGDQRWRLFEYYEVITISYDVKPSAYVVLYKGDSLGRTVFSVSFILLKLLRGRRRGIPFSPRPVKKCSSE